MANFFPPGFEHQANIMAIDFDGVIHNADKGWYDGTCYGEPLPGAIESIKLLSQTYKIVIFTAKAKPDRPLVDGKTGVELVKEWFGKYGLDTYISEITSEKPRANLYIDDNGYRFENWNDTLKFIKNI
tara:strand:- start:86 stop:469 length:384 start_codon:yes stop_codon:yes gene_type:complete